MPKSLNTSVKVGMAWVMVERGTIQVLTLLSSMVLARLLSPTDFGVLGIAALFTGLSTRLVKLGFGMSIVQRATVRPDHIATLFVTTLAINSGLCGALMLASPYVGAYFGSPLAGQVLAVLSLNYLVRTLGLCPSALLRRDMKFAALAAGTVVDATVKLATAVSLAWNGYGVWSLVYAELVGGVAAKIVLIYASGWRPGLGATRLAFRELFGFGMGVSLRDTFTYIAENIDNFVAGKLLGPASLGLYEKAYNLMDLPVKELSARMTGVLFPAFSRIQDEAGRLKAALRKTLLTLSLAAYPIFGTLGALAPAVIQVMYGAKWLGAVLPFQILCLAGPLRMVTNVMTAAINARGSIGPEVKRRAVLLVLLVVGSLAGARWGLVGIATAVAIVNTVGVILTTTLVRRICLAELGRDIVRPQLVPLAATAALVVSELAVIQWTAVAGLPLLVGLGASLAAGGLSYGIALYLLRDEALTRLAAELFKDLRPVWNRVAAMPARDSR
jgi:PST family polysaccharide transporter